MEAIEVGFNAVWRLDLSVFDDDRGHFFEVMSDKYSDLIPKLDFVPVQSNASVSKKGALRGIHFSIVPGGQAKWVTCLSGSILDCVVDLRVNSPTFGESRLVELSAKSPQAIYIGPGMGHAFLSLEDGALVNYLLDSPYDPDQEFAVNAFDPTLSIGWPKMDYIQSIKDSEAVDLQQLISIGKLPKFH
jgi:dTDP-4-dehydrorhamnose 3,5-epimerase